MDTVSGETIVYQYDALKRLISASSTPNSGSTPAAWTETFQFDGFGNLTAKTLNGTTTPIAVNAATNQLTSAYYDANGNMTSGTGASFTYDVSNRISTVTGVSGGQETYEYAPDNKRIHRALTSGSVDEWTFYGAKGEKLGVYTLSFGYDGNGNSVAFFAPLRTSVWFAGKLIYENGPVNLDRLGTNRASGARFLPFGEELTSTSNDRTKFATYNRDSYTGLDYADQRYYANTYGRFNTPDTMGHINLIDSQTFNQYAYVGGIPINRSDPHGTDWCDWGIDDTTYGFCGSFTDVYVAEQAQAPVDSFVGIALSTPNPSYTVIADVIGGYSRVTPTTGAGQLLRSRATSLPSARLCHQLAKAQRGQLRTEVYIPFFRHRWPGI